MTVLEIFNLIIRIVLCLDSVALVVVVLMQEGKQGGLGGAIAGGAADSYISHNQGSTPEGKLRKITIFLGIVFFAAALALAIFSKFING